MLTVVWFVVYILIGAITALTLSWKGITYDHIDKPEPKLKKPTQKLLCLSADSNNYQS